MESGNKMFDRVSGAKGVSAPVLVSCSAHVGLAICGLCCGGPIK
jgi:hypothetical protein